MSGSIAGRAVLLLKLGEALVEHLGELLCFVKLQLFPEDVGFPLDGNMDAVATDHPELLFHGFQKRTRVGFGNACRFYVL